MIDLKLISFEEILPIWATYLWPGRVSSIDPYSAIQYNSLPYIYNTGYKDCDPTFFGLYADLQLVGVNSGHPTGESYRSRGLYVFNQFRGYNYGTILLSETVEFARNNGYTFIWSIPRQTSFKSYETAGFVRTSDWFETETSEKNAYVVNSLI